MSVFTQLLWKDREVQYPGRRKITNVSTGVSKTVDVKRAEGFVETEGDKFNAVNFNNLESRLAAAFAELEDQVKNVNAFIDTYYPVGKIFMSLVDFELDNPNRTNGIFPKTKWVRLKDRLLIPDTTGGTEYTVNKQQFKLDGTINRNVGNSYVGYHSITIAEMPAHVHSLVDMGYHDATDVSIKVWKHAGDSTKYTEYATLENDVADTTDQATEDIPTGDQHTHGITLENTFSADQKEISTIQRCLKVYAWQRIKG